MHDGHMFHVNLQGRRLICCVTVIFMLVSSCRGRRLRTQEATTIRLRRPTKSRYVNSACAADLKKNTSVA
jgi:hypothetical protein